MCGNIKNRVNIFCLGVQYVMYQDELGKSGSRHHDILNPQILEAELH